MPTRVVLKEEPSLTRQSPSVRHLRTKILRDLNNDELSEPGAPIHLSTNDIRSSPRLLGYVYTTIASSVMLASVVQFYRNRSFDNNEESSTQTETDNFDPASLLSERAETITNSSITTMDPNATIVDLQQQVTEWKLIGSLVVASLGCFVSLVIVLAHFDTLFLPKVWKYMFRDGSHVEGWILYGFTFFWIAALHANTSTYSVGQYQPNVYFTTWISFLSIALNNDVWRDGADKRTILGWMLDKKATGTTTVHWIWNAGFLLMTALSLSDLYINRFSFELDDSVVSITDNATPATGTTMVRQRDWVIGLSISWGFWLISCLAIWGAESNHRRKLIIFHQTWLTWHRVEGILLVFAIGVIGYAANRFTGVGAPIHELGNAYFGMWGVFTSLLLTMGVWLRNKKYRDDERLPRSQAW